MQLTNGYLVTSYANLTGHGSDFSGFDLSGIDLTGADLRFAQLASTNLAYTNLTNADIQETPGVPVGADTSIYCPDSTVVSSPATCIGHGF